MHTYYDEDMLTPGQFIGYQAYVLRIVAMTASLLSMVAIPCVSCWWWIMCRRGRYQFQFRHIMIFSLLTFDWVKAVVLIVYPIRYLHSNQQFYHSMHSTYCDVVGFFTEWAIEGADISVFMLAFYTMLAVFWPKTKTRMQQHPYIVASALFISPFFMSSLGMIKTEGLSGYTHFTTWCYLRVYPIWYRVALSWGPRSLIMFSIAGIYLAIFLNVRRQIRTLEESLVGSIPSLSPPPTLAPSSAQVIGNMDAPVSDHSEADGTSDDHDHRQSESRISSNATGTTAAPAPAALAPAAHHQKSCISVSTTLPPCGNDMKVPFSIRFKRFISQFPGLGFVYPYDWRNATIKPIRTASGQSVAAAVNHFPLPQQRDQSNQTAACIQSFISSENYLRFQRRRSAIERQVSLLFIYPVVYLFIWVFPFIQDSLHYSEKQWGTFTIGLIADFMKPFSGFINAMVFLFKEFQTQENYVTQQYLPPSSASDDPNVHYAPPQMTFHSATPGDVEKGPDHLLRSRLWSYKFGGGQHPATGPSAPSQAVTSTSQQPTVDVISPLAPVRHNNAKVMELDSACEEDDELDLLDFLRAGPPAVERPAAALIHHPRSLSRSHS